MTKHRQPSMERYQVILAYDGSRYQGFQRQAHARSVQAVVEAVLGKIGWQGSSILAAGRTDTGVHATGQVIAFDLEWAHSTQALQKALNAYLPTDIVARQVERVCPTFHPRFDACRRKYVYRIYCQSIRQPLLEPYAWRVWPAVEIISLNHAAGLLVGSHDFSAFGTSPQAGGSTNRKILTASWCSEAPYLTFEITAEAYLYHMVRRLVFMQVSIAQEKLDLADLRQALEPGIYLESGTVGKRNASDRLVHGLAPARGLVLAEVHYPPESFQLAEDSITN